MEKFLNNFRKFAMRGNLIDMAVGIIIGSAFSTVVKSLVDDIIMPPIGLVLGNVDFADLFLVLREGNQGLPPYATVEAAQQAGAVTLNYGMFINNAVIFLIVALAVFLLVRAVNRLEDVIASEEEEASVAPQEKDCPYCYKVIPVEATRCPFCTSQLEETKNQPAAT